MGGWLMMGGVDYVHICIYIYDMIYVFLSFSLFIYIVNVHCIYRC